MNDAIVWNYGKTAPQACYSVLLIHIKVFFIHGEILAYIYQFYFFRAIMMCTVSEKQSRFFRFPENHWVV